MIDGWNESDLERVLGRPIGAGLQEADRLGYAGRRVVVTGAAGSIGSALARELAACRPASLTLVDQSELGLFNIERELRARWPDVALTVCLADVRHRRSMRRLFSALRPEAVYHAAAYKHVTMAERAPAAAAAVNVLGTKYVLEAASDVGARFLLISSDKAADPSSVMGATKRLAELVVTAAGASSRKVIVRFGNVLGSSGSVLPIVREAVHRGVPIPITDPDATRYYMTAVEAVGLVLRADLLARGGEIYWLELGQPVRLGDLAERVLALEVERGWAPVPIDVIGLRPGEKRTETLSDPALVFTRTHDERLRSARDRALTAGRLTPIMAGLKHAVARADDLETLRILTAAVRGFRPSAAAIDAARRLAALSASVTTKRKRAA